MGRKLTFFKRQKNHIFLHADVKFVRNLKGVKLRHPGVKGMPNCPCVKDLLSLCSQSKSCQVQLLSRQSVPPQTHLLSQHFTLLWGSLPLIKVYSIRVYGPCDFIIVRNSFELSLIHIKVKCFQNPLINRLPKG